MFGLLKSSWERQVANALFDFIEVGAFTNYKFSTLFNYSWMLVMLSLHAALYGLDIYTCVKLLAFNEWSSMVQPYISFSVSKWLFAACIIAAIVFLIFDAVRGIRIYRTGNIALIYTNHFAKTAKSLAGYSYFCVLNAINPSNGFDKVAFYTFFTLDDSKKIIFSDSPRQVINAITLYSVLNVGDGGFWDTLKQISTTNRSEALILYSMSFSLIIWIFFVSCLFFAICFCIPVYYRIRQRGFKSLRQYVCIKVDGTVKKLARKYSQKKLLKENRKRLNAKNDPKNPFANERANIPDVELPPLASSGIRGLPKSKTWDSIDTQSSQSTESTTQLTNPFAEQYPQVVYNKNPSQVSVLKRYDDVAQQRSVYDQEPQLSHYDSQVSLYDSVHNNFSSTAHLLKSESQVSLPLPLRKPPTSSTLNSVDEHAQVPLDTTSQYPQRHVFLDEEKHIGMAYKEDEVSDFDDFDDDDDSDDYLQDTSLKRSEVRPSLMIRARDIEMEDYSRFISQRQYSSDEHQSTSRKILR